MSNLNLLYNNKYGCFVIDDKENNCNNPKRPDLTLPNIKQNLWPFPSNIKQVYNGKKFAFNYVKNIPTIIWNNYLKNINNKLDNPFNDFNDYVSNLNYYNNGNGNSIQFSNITVIDSNTLLKNINSKSYKNLEQYNLIINEDGKISIIAQTHIGVSFALSTLQQLIEQNDDKDDNLNCLCIKNLPININDTPNTYFRCVMLDTARNYFSVDSIINLIKVMGYHKLNYLNWHISDDQSFPLSVGHITKIFSEKKSIDPTFKNMTGAFDINKVYRYNDIRKIVETAYNYGITIIPGIDSPGHCSALMYGSYEATLELFGESFQIIEGYQLKYQGSLNSPEPILGYLDIGNITYFEKIIYVMYKIFDETLNAFQDENGKYGNRFDINVDEISTKPKSPTSYFNQVYTRVDFANYMNKIIDLFRSDNSYNSIEEANETIINPKYHLTFNNYTKINVSMWVDSILDFKKSDPNTNDNNYIELSNLSDEKRITLGLWNFWPTHSPDEYNTLSSTKGYENIEYINFNANYFYMDSGFAGNHMSGLQYNLNSLDNGSENIGAQIAKYWVSGNPNINPSCGGLGIGWGKIYNYNYMWDFNGNKKPVTWEGMNKINNVVGSGLAVWTETISEGSLNNKLIKNLCSFSELLWKYNENHAADNINHAKFRLQFHLEKLSLKPYNITSEQPIYSGINIFRKFPQGNIMTITDDLDNNGNITNNYLKNNYASWDITIRDEYTNMINNNLMFNINPSNYEDDKDGALAIAQCPLSSLFMYANDMSILGGNKGEQNLSRLNPFLAEDLNIILKNKADKGKNIGTSNFSANGNNYHKYSLFYTDQQDAPIVLENIPVV